MAQQISYNFPLDIGNNVQIGFDLNFDVNGVFNPTYTTADQIKANLINYILINPGELVFAPDFGLGIRALLFEQANQGTLDSLEFLVRDGVSQFFPNVSIEDISFDNQADRNAIFMTITYKIVGFGVQDEINIELQ